MLPVISICVGLLAFFLARYVLNLQRVKQKFPPGPTPLPVIGNLWMLGFRLHHEPLLKMASKYGDVFTIWQGSAPVIVLNGFQAVKEVLIDHSEDFADRHLPAYMKDLMGGQRGVVFSNGQVWKQLRRISLTILRDLGMGKTRLEKAAQQEVKRLVQALTLEQGKPVDPHNLILLSVNTVVSDLLLGHHFSEDSKAFQSISRYAKTSGTLNSSIWTCVYEVFPWLMKLLGPFLSRWSAVATYWDDIRKLIQEEVEHHKSTWSSKEDRDFIDAYLAQIEKHKGDPRHMSTLAYAERDIVEVVRQLLMAGTETTSTSLYWALLYMVLYPEIQGKVQEELDAVLGSSTTICYEDRKMLPFTNAVLHETQRYSSLNSLGVVHVCSRDTTIRGFPVSKGTIVLPNLFSVHYDSEEWETPHKFNPGHFLDKDGNFVKKDAFLLFMSGVRVCLGERIARVSLFISFATLLKTLRFQLPEGVKEINVGYIPGIVSQPRPFKICAVPR